MPQRYEAQARQDAMYRWAIVDTHARNTIAICISRTTAVKIAQALNAQEAACTKPITPGMPGTA
jgi:hypothetical protein